MSPHPRPHPSGVTRAAETAAMLERARDLARIILGAWIAGVGVAFFLAGPEGMAPRGRAVFDAAGFAPWWGWATWALIAGALTLTPRTSVAGLSLGTAWLTTWGVIVSIGAIKGATALYVLPTYGGIVSTWMLVLVVHLIDPGPSKTDRHE